MSLCICALVTFNLESDGSDSWIKFNANMTGLYRVHYDDDNWRALIAQLKQDHSVSNFNTRIIDSIRCFCLLSVNNYVCCHCSM